MAKRQTRAQEAGVSTKRLARKADRFAARVRAEGEKIAYEWAEVDNTVSGAVDELLAAVERFRTTIKEGIEYLNEVPE